MDFVAFTYAGLAVGLIYVMMPGRHHVGPASSLALGLTGAWSGGLFVGCFRQGGWATFGGLPTFIGSVLGAVGLILLLEGWAHHYFRREAEA